MSPTGYNLVKVCLYTLNRPIRALGNRLRVIGVKLVPNGAPSNWLQLSLRAVVTIEARAIPSGTTSIERTVAT